MCLCVMAHEIFCVRPILEKAGVKWDSVSGNVVQWQKNYCTLFLCGSNAFLVYNGSKVEMADVHYCPPSLQTTHLEGSRTPGQTGTEWGPQTSGLLSCQCIHNNVKMKILEDTLCAVMEIPLQVDTKKTQLCSCRTNTEDNKTVLHLQLINFGNVAKFSFSKISYGNFRSINFSYAAGN